MKYEYVIIGNSAAAIGAVEAIRKNDRNGRIAIISSENYHVYSRPLISYLLLKKTNEEKMKYRDDSFYSHHGCELKLNKTAIRINPEKKLVILDDGSDIGYDKLLISTGSSPLIPPIPGLDQVKYKFAFTTLDDAKALENVLKENLRVLIIGAGLIGLNVQKASEIKAWKLYVWIYHQVLSSILDDESSEIVKNIWKEKYKTLSWPPD